MMKNKSLFFLFCIFILGLFLRVYKLDQVPVSLTIDEIGTAYDSYSILKTGRDQYGVLFPLAFRSIGDYKAPLNFYLMIPAIGLFGLNEFSTRITIALIGALTIFPVYKLIKLITKDDKIALISALSLAISPWHIKYSRLTFDGILGLSLIILGAYFFFKAIRDKKGLWISVIYFVLSLYSYHAERLFSPIFVCVLIFIYRHDLLQIKKESITAGIIGLILTLPIIMVLLKPESRIRVTNTFITRDVEINRFLHKTDETQSFSGKLFDNNLIITFNFWTKRYLDYFDPVFLFSKGMGYTSSNAPDLGLLYIFELLFFLLGTYLIFIKNKFIEAKLKYSIFFWIIVGILPASLANNAQHTSRSLTLIPLPQLFSGIGFLFIFQRLRKKVLKVAFLGISFVFTILGIIFFLDLYFLHYQLIFSQNLMKGWKEAAIYALENKDKYKEIVIDPRFGTEGLFIVGTPYLYLLFYGSIDPFEFQNDPRRKEFSDSSNFANFTFREIGWTNIKDPDKAKVGNLYVGSKWVLPVDEIEILKRFDLLNGEEILRAATPK